MDLSGVNYELAVGSGIAGVRHRAERQIGQIAGVNITVKKRSMSIVGAAKTSLLG